MGSAAWEALEEAERALARLRWALEHDDGRSSNGGRPPSTVRDVLAMVARHYEVRVSDISGPSRERQFLVARQAAMYLLHDHRGVSLSQIGRLLDRDHTTVRASVLKVRQSIACGEADGIADLLAELTAAQTEHSSAPPR